MMSTAEHPTAELPLIPARGEHGIIERQLLGSGETLDQNTRWHQRVTGPQIPGMVSTITLLFGTWLAITPLLWTHPDGAGSRPAGTKPSPGTAVAVPALFTLSCSSDNSGRQRPPIAADRTTVALETAPTSPIGGTLEIWSEGFAVGLSEYTLANLRTDPGGYRIEWRSTPGKESAYREAFSS